MSFSKRFSAVFLSAALSVGQASVGVGSMPTTLDLDASRTSAAPRDRGAGQSVQTAKIVVSEKGFEPAKVTLRAGVPVHLTFIRTTDKSCGEEVVFPSLKIKKDLPLNEPVVIEFTPTKSGKIAFACGMDMFRGTVVVQ